MGKIQKIESSVPPLIPYRKKDKWGFCTTDKTIVINCIYDRVFPFNDGFALVTINKKWGYINANGNILNNCWYDYATDFSNDLAMIFLMANMG